jgi:hypothetical protein
MNRRIFVALAIVLGACAAPNTIVRDPSTIATTKELTVGESVCWVEPKWMFPGPTDCNGYSEPAPGVPKCTTPKPHPDDGPRRTVWGTGYDLNPELTAITRKSEPLACCYRCVEKLHDLGD